MRKNPTNVSTWFSLAILFCTLCIMAAPAFANTEKTLENLQAAYNGESNAHAKYSAFAVKADEEGYGEVASLFRAAAKAEQIHLEHHARVIRQMDAKPIAHIKKPEVLSTKENLKAAIEGESYEQTTMYPEFIKVAEEEGNDAAITTFTNAMEAEAGHARMYTAALANLDALKGTVAKNYFVCTVCGLTVTTINFEDCPSCGVSKDEYLKIS